MASPSVAKPNLLRRMVRRFRAQPLWLRSSVLGLFVAALSVAGYYGFYLRPKAFRNQRSSVLWAQFDRAAKSGNDEELDRTLDELLALNPDDPLVLLRKRTLETNSAEESDAAMPLLTLPRHLKAGRWPDAEREAKKRLAHQPRDWLARCTTSKALLLRGDRAAAKLELDLLPDPKDSASGITPASLLFAFDLFRELERDSSPLRAFARDAVIDTMRSTNAEGFPVAVKVQLVECYLEGFEPPSERGQPTGLSRGVVAAGKLIDLALDDSSADAPALLKLGLICNRMLPVLALLRREDQITAAQYPSLAKDHEARTRRVWQSLVGRDPKAALAYHGLAIAALRQNKVPEARQFVLDGLEKAGDHPQLLALFSLLLRSDEEWMPALGRLLQAAERDPKNISLWLLAAETAEAAGRRDIALEACTKARVHDPKNPWVLRTEARIYIDAGPPHSHTGVQLLSALGEGLPMDAASARLYVRGLNESGLELLIEEFLKKVEAASTKAGSPQLIGQALRGLTESRFRAALAELALKISKAWLDRYPDDIELLTVAALANFRAAEQGEPRWNEGRIGGAIRGFEQLQSKVPGQLDLAAALAWVRLKGKREPLQALRDAAPLQAAAEQGQPLTAWQWQVLGATLAANTKFDGAVQALEKASRITKSSPGVYVHLALAYHGQGKNDAARTTLERARTLPRNGQEQADYLEAFTILQREKS